MDLCRVPSTSNLNLSMVSSLFLGSFQSLPIALTSNAVANLRTVHLLKVSSGVAVPSDWRFKSSHVRCSLPWSWSSSWQILCDSFERNTARRREERREMRDERWEMREESSACATPQTLQRNPTGRLQTAAVTSQRWRRPRRLPWPKQDERGLQTIPSKKKKIQFPSKHFKLVWFSLWLCRTLPDSPLQRELIYRQHPPPPPNYNVILLNCTSKMNGLS